MTLLLAAALVVACGDNSNHRSDAPGGDGNRAIDGTSASSVLVTPSPPPDFIAYRAGDGPWQTPIADGSGDYPIAVVDDYLVLVVCDAGGGGEVDAEEFGFTFSGDGSAVSVSCEEPLPDVTGSDVGVTGTMVQAGSVQVGTHYAASATSAWTYSETVPAGPHDVLAIDTANNAVFDHAVDFEGSAAIGPAIDTGSGAPLDVQPLVVTNLGSGQVSTFSAVVSTDESVLSGLSQGGSDVVGLPVSELAADDLEVFAVFDDSATTSRFANGNETGPVALPATYAMLDEFTTASFEITATSASGSWTTLPASTFDAVTLRVDNFGGSKTQQITASPSYLTARALTTLEFDDSAPGYLAAWRIDPRSGGVSLEQTFTDPTASIFYGTFAYPPSSLRADHRRALQRHHAIGARRWSVP